MKSYLDLTKVKRASLEFSQKSENERNIFLKFLSNSLKENIELITKANKKDIDEAKKNKLPSAFVQRLILDHAEVKKLILKLEDLQKLESGVGNLLEEDTLENGIVLKKTSTPLGVILVIYESRPEVTIDVAALCIKSGNAVILKGGTEAKNTNEALYKCIHQALKNTQLDKHLVSFVENRHEIGKLLKQNVFIDLVIARGSYDLVKTVLSNSSIPVLAHSAGGARMYIDKSAKRKNAVSILINAKVSKPAACNSLDTILVHKKLSNTFLLELIKRLQQFNVQVLGDERVVSLANLKKATKKDWDAEFLDLKVAIKIVDGVHEAIRFINKHTKRHSEGIMAEDNAVIKQFTKGIDAAAIFINCSTRFHDGYEFGLGSEMGISTGKLHARGPVGLKELTSYKWEVYGKGQIRE